MPIITKKKPNHYLKISLLSCTLLIDSTPTYAQEKPKPPPELDKEHWIEGFHKRVTNSVNQSAQWFDRFFVDDNDQQQMPTTTARIRLAWLPKSRDLNDIETRLRVKMKLPHFQNRASVELSDDTEDELNNLPLESNHTNTNADDEKFALAFNYISDLSATNKTKYRLGISGGDIFFKIKNKQRFSFQDKHALLIEPSTYYYLDDGLGAKLLLEYDYQLSAKSQFRLNYSIRGSESFSGIRWKHGLYKLEQHDENTASIISLQVEGERNGERGFLIEQYTLGYRYRFNAFRHWLFFEIEPFLEFPEKENYKTTPGIALRIEGFFHKG